MPRLASLLASLLLAGTAAAADGTITIVSDQYCPFNCVPGSDTPGYLVEVATKIFAAKGIKVDYKVVPWDTAVAEARAGTWNAVIGAYEAEVPGFVIPKEEMGRAQLVFVVRKGDPWRYTGPASLKGKKLGLVEGYSYDTELEAWLKANPGSDVRAGGDDPFAAGVKNLLTKGVDALVEESSVVAYKTGVLKLGGLIEVAGPAAKPQRMSLAFSPANPRSKELAQIFSDGMASMRKSGELAKILNRYGAADWK